VRTKNPIPIQRTYPYKGLFLGKKNAPQTSDVKEIFPKKNTPYFNNRFQQVA
jgi:hypothetical protein